MCGLPLSLFAALVGTACTPSLSPHPSHPRPHRDPLPAPTHQSAPGIESLSRRVRGPTPDVGHAHENEIQSCPVRLQASHSLPQLSIFQPAPTCLLQAARVPYKLPLHRASISLAMQNSP